MSNFGPNEPISPTDEPRGAVRQQDFIPPPDELKTYLLFAPFTAAALNFGWRALKSASVISRFSSHCSTSFVGIHSTGGLLRDIISSPFNDTDTFLRSYVGFYQAALHPSNPPFLAGDVSSIAALASIPMIESMRFSVTMWDLVSKSFLTNAISQLVGRGVIYPLWWASFISSGSARVHSSESNGSHIHPYDAEGALLANVLGFVIPGLGMSITKSPNWILTWWLYPVTFHLIPRIYRKIRETVSGELPHSVLSRSREWQDWAYNVTQANYLVSFLYATTLHLIVLVPRLFRPSEMKQLMKLSFAIPAPNTVALTKIAYQAIQWDAVGLFGSSIVAGVSLGRTGVEKLKIAAWSFVATVACGTGGAIAGLWAWRERRLMEERVITRS